MKTAVEYVEFYLINSEMEFHPAAQKIINANTNITLDLTSNVARMLGFLCENCNAVIIYDDLMQSVWGEKHKQVSYGSLYQTLLMLRKALKSTGAREQIIKTIRRTGVTFNADVRKITREETPGKESISSNLHQKLPKGGLRGVIAILLILLAIVIPIKSGALYSVISDNYTHGKAFGAGCTVRYNADAQSDRQHSDFLEAHPELCVPGASLYITTYSTTNDLSVIQCINDYARKREIGNCSVMLFSKEVP